MSLSVQNPKIQRSLALLEDAYRVIPSASQTFSKGPDQWARGVSPHFLERGEGAWVWDVDGNRYLDFLMALGPVILGYGDPVVNQAIKDRVDAGLVFSQMHRLEVEVAEMLCEIIPCAEMVRFGKNGSDVTTAAVRAARALTGRDRIAMCGYHGWHDWHIATTTRHLGIPERVRQLSHTFVYNDLSSLTELFDTHPGEFACVIMEGVGVEAPAPGFLEGVRAMTREAGTLLIFDEIVAGFRLALGGAQEFTGVVPDLACFGKAMGNGMPIAAVAGPRECMEVFDDIFFSGTFGGETASLAACKATVERIRANGVIDHLWRVGGKLIEGTQALVNQYQLGSVIKLIGYPPRAVMAFPADDERETRVRRTLFMQECVKRGLLYFCSNVPCAAHGDAEIAFALDVFAEVMPIMAASWQAGDFEDRLDSEVVEAIFRRA